MNSFFVVGSDKRTICIREMFEKENKLCSDISTAEYIVAPTPFTKDSEYIFNTDILIDRFIDSCKGKIVFAGAIANDVKEKFDINNIRYYDLMKYEDIAMLNAIPTAEGAIKVAMEKTDITLCNSKVLVLGYGNIGKVLSKMLSGIGANVYCEARKEKDLAQILAMGYNSVDLNELDNYLGAFDYIFNTIPFVILNRERIDKLKNDVCIIDLASAPYGVDFDYAERKGINAVLASALPSKVAPLSAAIYLKRKIDKLVQSI